MDKYVGREPNAELDALCGRVIGAAIEVHRALGPGFLERVYEQALCVELALQGLCFVRQVAVVVSYKGELVGRGRIDLVVEDRLIVEIKATEAIAAVHVAQVLSYLKATQRPLGLLITFNVTRLACGIKRVILSP